MPSDSDAERTLPRRLAFGFLALFLVAVLAALAVTLASAPPSAKLIASVAVVPVVAFAVLLLVFECLGRPWAFSGAAALGALGVALRLVVNTQPSLEVGGGLPIEVTIAYVGLGLALVVTSVWAHLAVRAPASTTGKAARP